MIPLAVALALGSAAAGGYHIDLPSSARLTSGATGAVSLTITPDPGFTVSRAGPLAIDLTISPDDGGVALPHRHYHRDDSADALADAPRFDVGLRAARAGSYRLAIDLRFWLCRRRTCWPVRAARTVLVEVVTPPESPQTP